MVLRYTYGGREYEQGGYAEAEAAQLTAWMAEDGITDVTVFDGEQYARERFPSGSRVVIPHNRKWWGSQVGTVVADEHGVTWLATDMGPSVMVRFDGEAVIGSWTVRSLERVS
jgi:hypothetical protein